MTRYRAHTNAAYQDALGDLCLEWAHGEKETALRAYSAKRGVEHLLIRARTAEADARMLGLHLLAAYANAWDTVVEPLAALADLDLGAVSVHPPPASDVRTAPRAK